MRSEWVLVLSAAILGVVLSPSSGSAQDGFPHDRHSLFFPECTACHGGIMEAGLTAAYPDLSTCTACHNGTSAPVISWKAPEARTSSLAFPHSSHDFGCQTCHLPEGPENLAALTLPPPETCLGCHAPETSHMETEDCGFCHRSVDRLDPVGPRTSPPFHGEGFVTSHGPAASLGQPDCTGCHTENSCFSCHDGQTSPRFHPVNFMASHGPEAYGRVSDCSSCHNPEGFCRECHTGLGFQGEGGLFTPFHNDQPLWVLSHAKAARQDLESCVSCHQQTDCLSCHSARTGLGVKPHGPDFNGSGSRNRNDAACSLCHISHPMGRGR